MKKYANLAYAVFLMLLISCSDDVEMIRDPQTVLSFGYQMVNTEDNASYVVESSQIRVISDAILSDLDNGEIVRINKGLKFEVNNSNHINKVRIRIQNVEENRELIVRREKNKDNDMYDNLDYISTDAEIDNYWKDPGISLMIEINSSHLMEVDKFKILSVKKALVNGEEKVYVEFSFTGIAYGYYDGYREYLGFIVENGVFKGILE